MKVFLHTRARGLIGVLLILLPILAIIAVPNLQWRIRVIGLHLAGEIPDIDFKELLFYMMPGSEQSMERLIDTRNPHASIRNFRTTAKDIEAGGQLFRSECAFCHGVDGSGAAGPGLIGKELKNGQSDWALYRTIRLGVPNTEMKPHPLPETKLWQLAAFIRSLDTEDVRLEDAEVKPMHPVDVPYSEIADTREPSADWLTFSGSYWSTRHSTLGQVHPGNVHQLGLKWAWQYDGPPSEIETSPLVRNGVMFATVPPSRVIALNATTGEQIWAFEHKLNTVVTEDEFGIRPTRGVALLNDKVYVTTLDARLIALSAGTGAIQWETPVSSDSKTYYISSAPLAFRDLIVTGVATRRGGRAFIAAYDANTGKERWRFFAIPGKGEFGNDTWAGDSWQEGGAPTWLTGSYDPQLDLVFWGIGNPKPDYDTADRKGDNLYSNCVVALRGSTGELVWSFQFTPADDHDWDANQIPVLADVQTPDGIDKRLLWANRNGFYYVLNRVTGKFLTGAPFVQQTWTDGLDSKGRPKPLSDSRSREALLTYPGNGGGTNWWPPSFDPSMNLMFVPVLEQGMLYFKSKSSPPNSRAGRSFYTAIRALEAETGATVWEHRFEPRREDNRMGGLLSTKTGLVFAGDRSTFYALDSHTGALLWSVATGGKIVAAPVTYESAGDQFVVIAAGRDLMTFSLAKPMGSRMGATAPSKKSRSGK